MIDTPHKALPHQNKDDLVNPLILFMTLERIQIDLINLEQTPDALMRPNLPALKYIGHIIDQFAKYNVLYALRTTSADEVAVGLIKNFLGHFGLPFIIQSDRGKKFQNYIIKEVIKRWPGCTKLISSKPRHPQSQGCAERSHQVVQDMIRKTMAEMGETR